MGKTEFVKMQSGITAYRGNREVKLMHDFAKYTYGNGIKFLSITCSRERFGLHVCVGPGVTIASLLPGVRSIDRGQHTGDPRSKDL